MGRARLALAALALSSAAAGAEEIVRGLTGDLVIYDSRPRLVVTGTAMLDPTEAQDLIEFQGLRNYYGAFVLDPSDGDYAYWTSGYQSPEIAQEVAYRACLEQVAPGHTCVLFARVDPEGWRPRLGQVTTLGGPSADSYRNFYLPGLERGGHAAFALSAVSSGAAVGQTSRAEAESVALDECEKSTRSTLEALTLAGRTVVRQGGRHVCRVVLVHSAGQ